MTTPASPYRMRLNLNVLNHLGLNLYSNVPAVLAEAVANSWDADARHVSITIDHDGNRIELNDDGTGMDERDINDKYLTVGYERRLNDGSQTAELRRPVMGRKGIGKLSLFSIAETIEVHTAKNGRRHGFRMLLSKIRDSITADADTYEPEQVPAEEVQVHGDRGTRIVLTDLKRRLTHTEAALRKRLARRFSIIGDEHQFEVSVNDESISVSDRDYFHKLQYLWVYGADGIQYLEMARNAVKTTERSGHIESTNNEVWGWIGTVEKVGSLSDEGDNLNKITILMRGKLAQEDILEDFGEGGIYSKYIIGEINADFLDSDEKADIATSSRQRIREDESRYQVLKEFIRGELKEIQNQWSGYRNKGGLDRAREIPAIKNWYKELPPDPRKAAKRLFGKINQLPIEDNRDRRNIIKNSVLAFESLRYKQNLQVLDRISADNLAAMATFFADYDDIEATLYHQIVQERLAVIHALNERVEESAREHVIRKYLFTHLWLLDPSWERATETPYMERQVTTEFGKIDAGLSDEERRGRVDIKYKLTSGKHVIVELKRASVIINSIELIRQVNKYRTALQKLLVKTGHPNHHMEIVCVVGREPTDWSELNGRQTSDQLLGSINARVVMYQQLIENAERAYRDFIQKHRKAGRVYQLIREIEEWEPEAV